MEVILAKSAGFCFGVERAIKLVYEQIENNKDGRKIYTFGPIIHNDIVVKDLESKGVFVFEDEDHFEKIAGSILIIRSHGVPKAVYEKAEKEGEGPGQRICWRSGKFREKNGCPLCR